MFFQFSVKLSKNRDSTLNIATITKLNNRNVTKTKFYEILYQLYQKAKS